MTTACVSRWLRVGLLLSSFASAPLVVAYPAQEALPAANATAALAESFPIEGELNARLDTPIELRFQKPLASRSVNSSTVSLLGPNGPVPISVQWESSEQKIQVRTKSELFPGSRYTVFVSDVRFAEGTPLPLTALTFKTQSMGSRSAPRIIETQPSAIDKPSVVDTVELLKATSSFDSQAKHLVTGTVQMLASSCDNKETFRGYAFCHKKGDITGGIFTPGLDNTDARWRLNTPLPTLPESNDFADGTFPKGKTALFGIVRRIDDHPIAGVTVSIGDLSTQTNAQGRFALIGTPTGQQVLVVDGSTANRDSEEYGQFTASLELKAQQINRVPYNLFLPRIEARDKIRIPSPTTEDLVVGHPAIPGLSIQIPAGTVLRNRQGQVVTEFAVVPMPVDRSPVPAPANFPVYISMQPGDATVESLTTSGATGLRVIYPNYTLENSKEQGFWYYDTDRGNWEVYASGHTSEDGKAIVPISNYGLRILMPQGGASIGGPDPPPPLRCSSGGVSDGDPVDCASGAFVHSRTDLMVADVPPLTFTRTYHSQDTVLRGFGRGMTNSYSMYLHVPEGSCYGIYTTTGTEMDLITGDGAVYPFLLISGTTRNYGILRHTSTPTRFYGAIMATNNHGDVTVTLTDGTVYRISTGCPTLLQSVTDRFGNTSNLIYNAGLLSQIVSSSGRLLSFTYNSNNLISTVSDNSGRSVAYIYDASKRLTKATYPDNTTETYTYDTTGNLLTVTDRGGKTMVTNQYDGNQRVSQQTYADGSTYQFAYTLSGTMVTATDVTDGRGNVKHMAFDAAGYLTALTRASGTALAQTTTYTRNTGELVTSITDPLGRTAAMTYNSSGDVLTRTFLSGTPNAVTYTYTYTPDYHQVASVTDPLGHATTYSYTSGCLTSVTDALGHAMTIACNSAGQPLSVTDALGHTSTLGYIGNDLQTISDPQGRTATFTTDNLGRNIAVKNPLGRQSRVIYDKNGQVTQNVDPLGQATAYSYDGNGNLTSVTDPNGGKTQFAYDTRNRPTTRTDALNQTESVTYDNMGNALTYTDRKGQQTTYQYDALNRASQVTYADSSTITPTYDAGNRITQIVDSVSGTIAHSYDSFDRLTQEQTPQGSVSYTYDAAGRRATMTPGSQAKITYTYDDADRLTQIQQGSETVSIAYDAANRRTSLTLPNGVVTGYTYDAANQLTGITYTTSTGTVLSSLAYTYDAVGQRISQTGGFLPEVLPTPTSGASVFDLNNRQTQWNGMVLGYDSNGDPTANAATTQSHTFDARQRLAQIQNSGTGATLATFSYDALGRRTGKTIGGTATGFLYDGLNPVQETQGATNYSILTGLGIDERYARSESASRYYFLTDALGSTLALTDSSATVQQQYAYEPYGEMQASGSSTNPYQFTGRENDGTGLYYYRHRYYSPTLKRFISADPMGLAAGMNEYAYADGDPVDFNDPYGLFSAADLPTIPEPIFNFTMGAVDDLSWGIGPLLRREWDLPDGGLDRCSNAYRYGGYATLVAGGWRSAYAGANKLVSIAPMVSGATASAARNGFKTFFRLGMFSSYRAYTYDQMLLKYGSDEAVKKAVGRTSPFFTGLGLDAFLGHFANEEQECGCQ